jgi:hypothetical protein
MTRNPSLPDSHPTEEVRFQLSLLHLLYPTGSSPQVSELESLLGNAAVHSR